MDERFLPHRVQGELKLWERRWKETMLADQLGIVMVERKAASMVCDSVETMAYEWD